MNKFLQFFSKSLTVKLIFIIACLILFGTGISWYALISTGKNNLLKDAVDYTGYYTDFIKKGLHYDMLAVRREAIQNTLENVGSKNGIKDKGIKDIRILDGKGKISYSSRPEELNRVIDKDSAACRGCHSGSGEPAEALGNESRWRIYEDEKGHRVLVVVEPLYNEPSCYTAACHFHPQNQKVLGMLEAEFSLVAVDEEISKQVLYTSFYALGFVIMTSGILSLFLWNFLHKPVTRLRRGMQKVAGGDLTHRIEPASQDEMGQLAGAYNRMLDDLKETTVSRDLLAQEVNQRKLTEERLREAESFVSTAFDSIRDPFIILDREYRIVKANEAYAEMRQIPLEELIGKTCHQKLYGQEAVCEECLIEKTFRSTDPCAKDKLIQMPDGTEVWFEIYSYPISDDDGQVTHAIEYLRDITDRRRAEKATKQAYFELDQIFNTATDGMCVIDTHFHIARVNNTFLKLFGLLKNEVIGEKCYDVFPGPECHKEGCPLTLIMSGKSEAIEFESEKIRKDGVSVPFILTAAAFRSHDGEVIGIVEDFRDITERKRMEEELRSLSLTDELTGLYNRRGLATLAAREFKMADRMKRSIILLYADLDGLKFINDNFGHREGDRVIIAFAGILKETYRESDIIARIGGDEFAVVPVGVTGENLEVISRRLEENIEAYNASCKLNYRLSASVGVAHYDPDHPSALEDVLLQGDKMMYEQKKAKRNLKQ